MLSTSLDVDAVEDLYSSGAYLKRDVQIVRGSGARLEDAAGNSYIDCVGGMGSANLGHAHPGYRGGGAASGRRVDHLPGAVP